MDHPAATGMRGMMDTEQTKEVQMPHIEVTKLADALGYGDGTISFRARESEVGTEVLAKAIEVITSTDILVPVDTDKHGNTLEDDGCGDGRGVGRIFKGLMEKATKSLNRAKVFGGGLAMGLASRIGLGEANSDNLNEEFDATIDIFHDHMIGYGAHTDEHAHGDNCGCGALDKAPLIVANAVKFESQIRGSIAALGIEDESIDQVFANYGAVAARVQDQPYSGKKVANTVMENGGIVKELAAKHLEAFIVLNKVKGYTVDQSAVRAATDDQIQIFAVDVWRMQEIVEKMYPNDDQKQMQAFIGELVYTLATAATLTPGDLPVYVASDKQFAVAAEA